MKANENMKNEPKTEITGHVRDVFAHRFVIETGDGERILADLGPEGLKAFPLRSGAEVVASGEMKPSELKVATIAAKGGQPVETGHGHKGRLDGVAEPGDAAKAVEKAGFEAIGEPRRKPKHFEVLGRRNGKYVECHVEFDGKIRKEKAIEAGDDKWADEMKSAA